MGETTRAAVGPDAMTLVVGNNGENLPRSVERAKVG